ncbi:LysR substrate-binding domain-containing protein [Rhizobium mesosinicum]|uniref:LysR family transcriptional regulator n=1 Tax=Rhizobium mesosinicum TaxID=335017 RepID=A0ABS7GNV0_9HYPH|nr:LysR substrate-binding domain-containing protein [Rhizobium mesosinicum]MBW9051013.1 LysR family transcriptional regulator [Rhizobium mesosinicum]
MFEPELVRAFVTVIESGGFSRAAERLNATQSTISYQIKRLESQAGRTFINRTTRSVSLTEDGEVFMGYAQKFLRLVDDAKQHFGAPKLAGTVRFGASDDFATYCLPELLARFRRIHPDVTLSVEIGISRNLVDRLYDGDFDLVLGKRALGDDGGELVFRERMNWVAAHDYDFNPEEPVQLAVFPQPCIYRATALEALGSAGRPWHIVYTCPSLSGVRAAALSGFAITPLASDFVSPELRVLPDSSGLPPMPEIEFALYWGKGGDSAAARAFGDLIRTDAGGLQQAFRVAS